MEEISAPVSGGRLLGSLPGHGSSSSHSSAGVEERADEPGEGVFRTFPQNKKMRSWLRTRVRECQPVAAHPRRLLSWRSRPCRTPSSGCSSGNATLASLTSGTVWKAPAGVEVVWFGERNEEGGVWYWHRDTRVSTFDFPPLPPGRGAVPPAQGVNKYWAPCRLCCRGFLHREQWSLILPSTWHTARVGSDLSLVQLTPALWVYVHFCAAWTTFYSLSGGDGFSGVLTAYGPSYLAATCSMSYRGSSTRIFLGDPFCIQRLLVRNVPVYSALVGSTVDTSLRQSMVLFAFQRNAWFDSGHIFASVYGALSYSALCLVWQWIKFASVYGTLPYFSAMLGLTVDTYCRRSSSFSQWHGSCWFAGCDAFALCSLRRRQARGVSTGAVAATVPAASLPAGMRCRLLGPCA